MTDSQGGIVPMGHLHPNAAQLHKQPKRILKEDIETLAFHTSFLRAGKVELDEGIITRENAEAKAHNEQWEKRKEKND